MQFRAPVPDDAPAVLAVLAARDLADLGVVDYTLEDLHDEWRASDVDLSSGAQVVELGGDGIVAYAMVRRPGTLAAVHPDHEGQGIGARLLAWAERRERELARETHRQWVGATNASGRALLTSRGYRRAGTYSRMVRALGESLPPSVVPDGYRLRSVDVARDAVALHAVDALSFAGAPDYVPESVQEFTEEHLEAHDFEAELSRVATADEETVAFLLARRWAEEGVGYIDVLAVHPDHQGRGLGTALLASAFAAFAAAGLREAQLGVHSANLKGLRLYERVGMTVRHQTDIYERPTDATPSRWRAYRDVDAAEEPASLVNQLEEIAAVGFVAREKRRSIELLGLGSGASVVDVGCGTGVDLEPLAEIVGPDGRVVGIERSEALLAAARERRRERPGTIELVPGDACALPFPDAEFDACRADRTLQHIEAPHKAIAEMIRVLRPGGRLVMTESRWGLVAPTLEQELSDRVLGLLARETSQADWLGHRLPAMFERAGVIDVRAFDANHAAVDLDELFGFTHLRGSLGEAVARGALEAELARGWLNRLEELVGQGEAFVVVLIRHVAGTRQ